MTASGPRLPSDVRQFLHQAIERVEQLEVAMFLQQNPDRSWDAATIADRLRLTSEIAAASLESLARHGVLDVRLTDVIKYRYSPATAEQRRSCELVAAAWREHRQALIEEVMAKRRALQDFSDAFRFGKNGKRG